MHKIRKLIHKMSKIRKLIRPPLGASRKTFNFGRFPAGSRPETYTNTGNVYNTYTYIYAYICLYMPIYAHGVRVSMQLNSSPSPPHHCKNQVMSKTDVFFRAPNAYCRISGIIEPWPECQMEGFKII